MALLLAFSILCGGFTLLTAVYPLCFLPALICLGGLLACSLRLLRQSRTDPLTGLNNLYRLDSRKNRYKKASWLWVFYIDVDCLKQVNDHAGHAAGDQLLRQTALFLLAVKNAEAYRIGGDEFLLVFPSGAPDAFLSCWQETSIPASCGSAQGPGSEFDALVLQAEQAMYASRAKRKKTT